jgi:NADH:ubiquinone oxidoreductase subunit K
MFKTKPFVFTKRNYLLILIAISLLLLGFFMMTGTTNSGINSFNKEIFSFRRITLAPVIVLMGYLLVIYAILSSPEKKNVEGNDRLH